MQMPRQHDNSRGVYRHYSEQGNETSYDHPEDVCSIDHERSPYNHFIVQNSNQDFAIESSSAHRSSPDNNDHDVSCLTEDFDELRYKLIELETALLGPDDHHPNATPQAITYVSTNETIKRNEIIEMISKRDLENLLVCCAKAIAENDLLTADWLMTELRSMVSVSGDPIQRLGAYVLEGLVARLASSGSAIYKALKCKEPVSSNLLSYMHILYEICPYFKFGYMSANGAIAEAMKNDDQIHIIDFQIAQGSQWVTLIEALAARPGGPPKIRLTGIDDPTSAYARGGGLELVGRRLEKFAELFNVSLEFNAVPVSCSEVELRHLPVRIGEPLAVNFAIVLHHMPDESVSVVNHRDRILRLVKGLSPKIVTLVEQELNTNTAPFVHRFVETVNYYSAIFDSIEATLPRHDKERINVEQHCLAREVVNVIACEGAERVERHELLGKWKLRFRMAGFVASPLNSYVNETIRRLLESYNENYRLEERDGALFLGWGNRDLIAACAWQ
ncbi:scarecrow-like protein 21 [Impatiens glandulifera]|uniref:scarecrow-like protein 21 n=1 Tax=Impatiens glandulifera TaxID=253017 RepID=UPI001FB10B7E|nr:scarecrow-like protein 21 [Impatiens glandulifera]